MVAAGASTGIGLAAAIQFAQLGLDVVAAPRTQHRSQPIIDAAAAGVELRTVPIDVSDDRSVQAGFERGESSAVSTCSSPTPE